MQLFQQPLTAASLVIHILAINLFLGRAIALDGRIGFLCLVFLVARQDRASLT